MHSSCDVTSSHGCCAYCVFAAHTVYSSAPMTASFRSPHQLPPFPKPVVLAAAAGECAGSCQGAGLEGHQAGVGARAAGEGSHAAAQVPPGAAGQQGGPEGSCCSSCQWLAVAPCHRSALQPHCLVLGGPCCSLWYRACLSVLVVHIAFGQTGKGEQTLSLLTIEVAGTVAGSLHSHVVQLLKVYLGASAHHTPA